MFCRFIHFFKENWSTSIPAHEKEEEIHVGCWTGKVNQVHELLKSGIDPNITDREQVTPLHIASLRGLKWIARELIDRGAKMTLDCRGQSPLYWAAYRGKISTISLLFEKFKDIDPNAPDNRGKRSLRAAAKRGHREAINALLGHGADLSLADGKGWTPLHLCYYHGHITLALDLIHAGANPKALDLNGRTPQDLTGKAGLFAKIRSLFQKVIIFINTH